MNRKKTYEKHFSALSLCIAGLLIMPSLLFNPSTEYRIYQFLFFWFLVWLSGRNINFFFTVFFIASITAFNLFVPYGQVLFSFGIFKITSGALEAGLHRAVTFTALVMLSKISIRQDLKIPGAFGELLSESLCIFSAMLSRRRRVKITKKNLVERIDAILLDISGTEPPAPKEPSKTSPLGYVILALIVILSWVLFGMNYLSI